MPRPRKYTDDQPGPSGAERVRASRGRRLAAGQRELRVWLTAGQLTALEAFAAARGLGLAEALALLVDQLTEG